ncbi:MAG: hypothetical protein IT366_12335 [Candidatus Hydrogenedentes bacterium]|nr:hypothetical protein [Candidatus Hydrogenedentota bacterium]
MRLSSVQMPLISAVSSGITQDQTLADFGRQYIDRVRFLINGEPDDAIEVLGLQGAECQLREDSHVCHTCNSALRFVCGK